MKLFKILIIFIFSISIFACSRKAELTNGEIKIEWKETSDGWIISSVKNKNQDAWKSWGNPDGKITILFSEIKPNDTPLTVIQQNGDTASFPEDFKYVIDKYKRATSEVPMNIAGKPYSFYPQMETLSEDSAVFSKELEIGKVFITYMFDENYSNDICVKTSFVAYKEGYFSLASVSLGNIDRDMLKWGIVPGFFQGNKINEDFNLSYVYAQGLPEFPVLCRESTITSPMAALTNKTGNTLAVIVNPEHVSERYVGDKEMHNKIWKIALSHMNKKSELTPTAYHPILGEEGSRKTKGDTVNFAYRFTLKQSDWFDVYKHAVYDIYDFNKSVALKESLKSLTDRILSMKEYLTNDKTSFWKIAEYNDLEIGAQLYMSAVSEAENDAIKNSDIAAAWMLSSITDDEKIKTARLPYLRNFKITQQEENDGFFHGATKGQYYLMKKKIFTEEWGNHYEPIGLTYYTLIDIANILLYEPNDSVLLEKLKDGAERLISWQREDGSWPFAFDKDTHEVIYKDLQDYRPTFYGMYVAYKMLKDKKYLDAAIKGADWYIKNAVTNGTFIGVCGDVRFVNDFATAQSAQALLDLYEVVPNQTYLDAAIEVAKIYTTSIYTYPTPSSEMKIFKGKQVQDWQLSQVGLGFEHGGTIGSAVDHGPILLSSHAGMFVRIYQLTKEAIFLDMARAAAIGRDVFVNKDNNVASYYWKRFDEGPGVFPHHGWWQVGWIMDYLVAEAEFRSGNAISFPRGYVSPKVGPHQPVGFEKGRFNDEKVSLLLYPSLLEVNNPNIDYFFMKSENTESFYLVLLNQQQKTNNVKWSINLSVAKQKGLEVKERTNTEEIDPWGIKIIKINI